MATSDKVEWTLLDTDLTTKLAILSEKSSDLYLEFCEPGSGSLTISLDSHAASLITSGMFCACSYRGSSRGGFFIDNIKQTDADGTEGDGRWVTLSGRGALAILDDAIVWDDAAGNSAREFVDLPYGEILATLIDEAQARGGLSALTYDFTTAVDSSASAWTDSQYFKINVGTSLLDVIRQIIETGTMEVSISLSSGTFNLSAYKAGIGTNKSDSVYFRIGSNCTEVGMDERGDEVKNALRVKYKTGYLTVKDDTSISLRRRREELLNIETAQSSDSALTYASAKLDSRKDPRQSITVKLYDGQSPFVFEDYIIGDTVTIDRFGSEVSYRVLGIQATMDGSEYASVTVELNYLLYEHDLEVEQQLDWLIDQWNGAKDGDLQEVRAWMSIGEPNGEVYALYILDGYLYVGGDFTEITGVLACNYIARYELETGVWSALPDDTLYDAPPASLVKVLAEWQGELIACTETKVYRHAGGTSWIVDKTFVGTPDILCASEFGSDLYVGGSGLRYNDVDGSVTNVVKFNGSTWTDSGSIDNNTQICYQLIQHQSTLFGGFKNDAGVGNKQNALQKLSAGEWVTVLQNTDFQFGEVKGIAAVGEALYFIEEGGTVSYWDGVGSDTTLLATLTDYADEFTYPEPLAVYVTDILIGAQFTEVDSVTGYNNLAKYSANTWTQLGEGLSTATPAGHNDRAAAIVTSGLDIFVGGLFTTADGKSINNLAVYITSFESLVKFITNSQCNCDLATIIHSAGASAVSALDEFPFWEDTSNALRKITFTDLVTAIGAGASTFLGLTDTPASYSGQAGKIVAVNSGETALEFINKGSSYIDQSGGTSDTYGVLSGTINGSNTTFTVSAGVYISGSLFVYLNGQLQTQGSGEDWVETTPASGTFDFAIAPETGDEITVVYGLTVGTIPDADEISIADAGGYFTATDVEAVTQEIATKLGIIPIVQNGLAYRVPASSTHHFLPYTTNIGAGTYNAKFPKGGTLSNLSLIITFAGQPATGSLVVTIYINGVASALTITFNASDPADTTREDTTHTVAINDGDKVRIVLKNNATSNSAGIGACSFLLTY